ncbi:hypothetical protein ACQ4PT_026930 [Festuca glaucescens]
MEGSSCPPPSAVGSVPTSTPNVPALPEMESVNSLVMPDYLSDANSIAEINSPMLNIDTSSTPKKRKNFSQDGFLFIPECAEEMKPKVGMLFEEISSAEKFYKQYAHHVGFSVRRGQQLIVKEVLQWKRFKCAREGYRSTKGTITASPHKKKRKVIKLTRCGCDAQMYVKRDCDGKYKIVSVIEQHNHELVSPSKQHLIRSNRQDCDAQMLVDQLGRMKKLNAAFFFEYEVDEHGKMVRLFWADATSRKNYKHFPDVLSFDSTYSTNQYDMVFAPFTGINHHMQSVFFAAGFLAEETIEEYTWMFQAFLRAMGGIAPRLIITDECARIGGAIRDVLPNSIHRLCMWHILQKVRDKVEPSIAGDEKFWERLNKCVWRSETPAKFEERWHALISDFKLEGNVWLAKRFDLRKSWIPAYFMDIPLAGILRTTSRSESENAFFKSFVGRKLAYVEFWLRFDTALQCQRQEELIADNSSIHTTPTLLTTWEIERQGSEIFTHEVFALFQKQVNAAREDCDVQTTTIVDGTKVFEVSDAWGVREVRFDSTTMIAKCSCKLFESKGILCRHIIRVFRASKLNELPSIYVLKRWEKKCKRDAVYDGEGNLLEENAIGSAETTIRRKIATARNMLEEIIRDARASEEVIDFINTGLSNLQSSLVQKFQTVPPTRHEEQETFIGTSIPTQIAVFTASDTCSRGTCSRIRGHRDDAKGGAGKKKKKDPNLKVPRQCGLCKEVGFHDARKCPKKT